MFCCVNIAGVLLSVALGRGCPPGYIDTTAKLTGDGATIHLAWKPPAGFAAGTKYEILSSEGSSTSSDYCLFENGAEQHVIATTTETTFDYHVPDHQVVQFSVRVAGCPNLTSPYNAAETFAPPRAPTVTSFQSLPNSGTVTFTFSEDDVHTGEIDLTRVDPAGEAPDLPPVTVYPTFANPESASSARGYCPAGSRIVVTDSATSDAPLQFAPGAYLYQLVAINAGLGHGGDSFGSSQPICVNINCPACNCFSTLTPVEPNCESDTDVECDRGIPADLSKLFLSPRRSYVTADGATELVLFQAESSDNEIIFSMKEPIVGSYGTLRSLDGGQSGTSLRVRPQLTIGNLHYAFVRYRAPVDLPSSNQNFYIEATIPSQKPLPPGQWYYRPVSSVIISFVPPPVVVVHGVWSGPQVWDGLRAYLRQNGRVVCDDCAVDYGDALATEPNNAPSFDPISSASSPLMDALDRAIDAARAEYRLSGFAVAQVDAIGHSMGGLVLRARTVFPYRAYERGGNAFRGDFHKLITIGTPHEGSPLADWLIAHKCDKLSSFGTPTIEEQLTTMRDPLGPAIYELQTGSPTLRRLGQAAVPSRAIVGIAPNAITELEDTLNLLSHLSGNAIGVEGIMSAAGVHEHDVIVPAESQAGGLPNPTAVPRVVHTRINAGTLDVPETASTAVWSAVLDTLRTSVTSSIFGTFVTPPEPANPALEDVPCSIPVSPPPPDDAKGLSVFPGTIVHPDDALPISYTPSVAFDGCFVTIGGSTFVRNGSCAVTWTVPRTPGGRIAVTAATFGSGVNVHATSYVLVKESSAPSALRLAPSTLVLHAIGATAQLSVTALAGTSPVLDVTSSTASTTYSTQRGTSIVSVSGDGRVTAVAEGKDIISASHAGLTTSMLAAVVLTNHPPTLGQLDATYLVQPGTTTTINFKGTDLDANRLAYSVVTLPPFATLIDHGDGTAALDLRPSATDVGAHDAVIALRDDGTPPLGAVASFTIVVTANEVRPGRRRAVRH